MEAGPSVVANAALSQKDPNLLNLNGIQNAASNFGDHQGKKCKRIVTREGQAEMLQCNVIPKRLAHLEKAGNQKYRELI